MARGWDQGCRLPQYNTQNLYQDPAISSTDLQSSGRTKQEEAAAQWGLVALPCPSVCSIRGHGQLEQPTSPLSHRRDHDCDCELSSWERSRHSPADGHSTGIRTVGVQGAG